MKFIPIRLVVLLFLTLLGVLTFIVLPSLSVKSDAPIIYVRVTNHGDTYILSFRAGIPGANTVYTAKNLPKTIDPDSLYITPHGEWLFEVALRTTIPTFIQTYYTRLGKAFLTTPINALWWSLSADSQYLFYAGVDATGYYETFNLLRLATGTHTEFMVAPLITPVLPNQPPGKPLSKYLLPMDGWTLNNKQLLFNNFRDYPGFAEDIIGFSSIDLSHIDFSKSGSYPLPLLTPIPATARHTGVGVLSPDWKSFAYVFLPATSQVNSAFDAPNKAAIYNLINGSTITLSPRSGEIIYSLDWTSDSLNLIYYSYIDNQVSSTYRMSQYDIARSTQVMLTTNLDAPRLTFCGNQFFESSSNANHNTETLYSYAPNTPGKKVALFSADHIDVLGCAPSYEWDTAKVAACNPFCTPTPSVPVGGDIAKLNLSGGDPTNGQQLYNELSCAGCHLGAVGPITAGTFTRVITTRLKDPLNVGLTAQQYLAQSIIQPDAYVVPTYSGGIMPRNYGDRLALSQLRDLVAFLMTQK